MVGEGGSKERGWRVPRQRFCSSARETETFAVRAGEGERERESAASRENDSRRTNEKGSTMTAKRAHPPRRFDLSVLESLKRRLSFGRDVRITNIYIYSVYDYGQCALEVQVAHRSILSNTSIRDDGLSGLYLELSSRVRARVTRVTNTRSKQDRHTPLARIESHACNTTWY